MSRITFQKRQKEMKRKEKQLVKAARRAQKKSSTPENRESNHNATDASVTTLN